MFSPCGSNQQKNSFTMTNSKDHASVDSMYANFFFSTAQHKFWLSIYVTDMFSVLYLIKWQNSWRLAEKTLVYF